MENTRLLGRTGLPVCRLAISGGYGVPAEAVEMAFERGVNYLYYGSLRRGRFATALKNLASRRDRFVLVVQSYSRVAGLMAWSLESALRAAGSEYADVLLLGKWDGHVPGRILDAALALRERGLARFIGVSTHRRITVPRQAAPQSGIDVVHFRYNAAHPGAERDVFPHLPDNGRAGLVAFTATNWRQLLSAWRVPRGEPVPAAADCYRFVLTRPEVDVCLTGPSSTEHVKQSLRALEAGPMTAEELAWMKRAGRAAH
jgi:aryl-alcohol dehydrogenase-like predicted oxidoreductase